jgi:hypothetical protein
MDLSERWRLVCHALAYIAVFAMAGAGFFFAYKMQRRWKKGLLFSGNSVLLVVGGVALWLDMTVIETSRMRGPSIVSPDGTHVAVVYWDLSGAVGTDHVNVLIRRKNSPFATAVFRDEAQAPPDDPKVSWTDDHHLLISYWSDGTTSPCEPEANRVPGIELLCRE